MPNWCENALYIDAPEEDIAALKAAIAMQDDEEQGLLNHLRPQPEYPDDDSGPLPAWYNWRVDNWGTKWEVQAEITGESETCLYLYFNSAWSPPVEAIRHWVDQDDRRIAELRYIEWGMGFCGIVSNDEDTTYTIPSTVEDVQESIPADLDEQFGISEMVEQWENEELAEEQWEEAEKAEA
mgnify:CR=1 FL=1